MKLDFAFICDYADVSRKINALGIGFDTIFTKEFPCKHPLFFLVLQLRSSIVEMGEKNIEVRLIDEDGKDMIPAAKAKFTIPKPPSGTESVGRIAMALRNVEFPREGSYSIHAVIDGYDMVDIPLRVSEPPRKKEQTDTIDL